MRLRQIALVARDLGSVVDDLCAVLGIEVAFNDPGVAVFGLENAVMPIGDTFLEVVSPKHDDTTAARFLSRLGGDGGYMAIFQVADLSAERARLAALGVRVVWEIELEDAATIHLHPKDVGGAIVSLDQMSPPESWRWAGPNWRSRMRTEDVTEIIGLSLESENPTALSRRWSEVLGANALQEEGDQICLRLDGGTVRFASGKNAAGAKISEAHLRVTSGGRILERARRRGLKTSTDAFEVCGVRFRLSA